MKVVEVKIRLPVDDGVSAQSIKNVIANQLYFLVGLYDLEGGIAYWKRAGVTAAEPAEE